MVNRNLRVYEEPGQVWDPAGGEWVVGDTPVPSEDPLNGPWSGPYDPALTSHILDSVIVDAGDGTVTHDLLLEQPGAKERFLAGLAVLNSDV